jgi:hypothetical protein
VFLCTCFFFFNVNVSLFHFIFIYNLIIYIYVDFVSIGKQLQGWVLNEVHEGCVLRGRIRSVLRPLSNLNHPLDLYYAYKQEQDANLDASLDLGSHIKQMRRLSSDSEAQTKLVGEVHVPLHFYNIKHPPQSLMVIIILYNSITHS